MGPLKCIGVFIEFDNRYLYLLIWGSHCFDFFWHLQQLEILSFELWIVIAMIKSLGWPRQIFIRSLKYNPIETQWLLLIEFWWLRFLIFNLIDVSINVKIIGHIEYIFFISHNICVHCLLWESFFFIFAFNEGLRLNAYCIAQILLRNI